MKKRGVINRVTALLLAVLTCGTLAGCNIGKGKKATLSNAADKFQEKQLTEETLTFYLPGNAPEGSKKVIQEIEKRLKPTLNVKLNIKWVANDGYADQVKSTISSGQPVDVFVASKSDSNDTIAELAQSDQILDLTSLLKEKAPRLDQLYSADEKANATYNGKVMGLPPHLPRSRRICVVMLEDAVKKFNVTDIKTFEDYDKLLRVMKDNETNAGPTATAKRTIDLFAEFAGYVPVGAELVYKRDDPKMKLIPWEQTPEFRSAVATLQRWDQNKYTSNEYTQMFQYSGNSELEVLNQGLVNSILTDWETAQEYIHMKAVSDFKVKIFPLYPDQPTVRPTDTIELVLNKNCKDPERVLKFLEWTQSNQENYDLFMYGIKDENYVLKGDKVEFPANKVKYFGWDGSLAFLNLNYMHPVATDPDDYKEVYKNLAEEGTQYAPSVGFRPETAAVQDIINKRNEYFAQGEMTMAFRSYFNTDLDVDNFIRYHKVLGVDKLVAEMQKQLDEWKTQNQK